MVTEPVLHFVQNRWFRDPYSNPNRSQAVGFFPRLKKRFAYFFETRVGFEPTNDGFANRSVKPLRHRVLLFYFLLIYSLILITVMINFNLSTLVEPLASFDYYLRMSSQPSCSSYRVLCSFFQKFFHSTIFMKRTLEKKDITWYSILRIYAPIAQLVEHRTLNPQVVGSIPTGGTIMKILHM